MFKISKFTSQISYKNLAIYFSKMASKGFMIAIVDKKYHYYTKISKQNLDFKVIIFDEKYINKENYINEMESIGWNVVCRNSYLLVFSKRNDEDIQAIEIEPDLEYKMVKSSYIQNEIVDFILISIALIFSVFKIFVIGEMFTPSVLLSLPLFFMALAYILKTAIWFYINYDNAITVTKLFHYEYHTEKVLNTLMIISFLIWLSSNTFLFFNTNYDFSINSIYASIYLAFPGLLLVWYYNYILKNDKNILIKIITFLGIIILWCLFAILPLVFRVF